MSKTMDEILGEPFVREEDIPSALARAESRRHERIKSDGERAGFHDYVAQTWPGYNIGCLCNSFHCENPAACPSDYPRPTTDQLNTLREEWQAARIASEEGANMTPLESIAQGMRMDKFVVHSYGGVYNAITEDMRESAKSVLEIGIGSGDCLRMWKEWFPHAQIIGVDVNDPMPEYEAVPRIRQFKRDATTDDTVAKLALFAPYSLIVDDGSHRPEDQIATIAKYANLLSDDGILVVEDVADYDTTIPKLIEALNGEYPYEAIDLRTVKNRYDDVMFVVWRRGRPRPFGLVQFDTKSDRVVPKHDVAAILKQGATYAASIAPIRAVKPIPANPRIALVIGTFAAVPYIHLQLESLRRFNPELLATTLVHDDHSGQRDALQALCDEYGAEYYAGANESRNAPCVGDMSCYVKGLEFADEHGCDLLVKFSRRWIPFIPWAGDLSRLAQVTQAATYSGGTAEFGFGFRTECLAMHVSAWLAGEAYGRMKAHVDANETTFVEAVVHDYARIVWRDTQSASRAALEKYVPGCEGFQYWPLLGIQRTSHNPGVLWHDIPSPHIAYYGAAQAMGLTQYTLDDFEQVNGGEGNMPASSSGKTFAGVVQ